MLGNISNFPPVNNWCHSRLLWALITDEEHWHSHQTTSVSYTQMFLKHWNLWAEIFHSKEHVAVLCQHTQEVQPAVQTLNYGTVQNSPNFSTEAFQNFCPPTRRSWALHFVLSRVRIYHPLTPLCAACRERGQQSDFIIPAPHSSFKDSLMSRNTATVEIISTGS